MMRSLFSGVSGLKSHQTRMDVIGNNISNINTVGFKSSRATFSDMLSQTSKGASSPSGNIGGTNPMQIGLGAAVASIDLVTNDGSPQSTGKNTDVALSGNGMFVLKRGDSNYYTRDGAFEFDNDGNYVLPGSGYYVQGWNAVDGSLNTNADPTNIVVPAGRSMAATSTAAVDFSGNLNASSPTILSITYTEGASGTDPDSVVNAETISGVSYTATWEGAQLGAGSTDSISLGSTTTPSSTNGSLNPGEVTKIVLTLSDRSTATITTGTDTYTVGASYGSSGATIETIDYTLVSKGNPLTTAGESVTVGSTTLPTAAAATITPTTVSEIELTVKDKNNIERKQTITENNATYSYDDVTNNTVYNKTSSVNVDGVNVIAATLSLSDGTTQKVTSGFYEVGHSLPVTTIVTIYDSEGKTHAVTMLMDKDEVSEDPDAGDANIANLKNSGKDNRWRIYLAPAVGEMGPSARYSRDESDGSHTEGLFNQSETYPDGRPAYIYFNDDGSYNPSATSGGNMFLTYSNGNGAADTTSSVNFTGLTQYSGSSTAYPSADGNSFGVLQSVSIDTSGVLTGTYTNGVLRFEAQIAVAQFINPAGLTKAGTSLYQESNNSGTANIKTVTDLGLTITPSALEMSNVDLASELADMIVTQRGFQSNSKIISVGDEMLETLINMKR